MPYDNGTYVPSKSDSAYYVSSGTPEVLTRLWDPYPQYVLDSELVASIGASSPAGSGASVDAYSKTQTDSLLMNKATAAQGAKADSAVQPGAMASAISTAVNNLVNGSPGALDTLKELADAMGDDPNFAASVTNALATKVNSSTYTAGLSNEVARATAAENGKVAQDGTITKIVSLSQAAYNAITSPVPTTLYVIV